MTAMSALPICLASVSGPPAKAKLKKPNEVACVSSVCSFPKPIAMAEVKSPADVATVLGPSPSAKLPTVLKQPPPSPMLMLMPLIPMHVALAVRDPTQ